MHLFMLCQIQRYILDISFKDGLVRAMEDEQWNFPTRTNLSGLVAVFVLYIAGDFTRVQNRENLEKACSSSIRCVIVRMHL